ncbi:YciI family protein [Sulfuriferula thiophila]|uniref:YciI family protein n=1 Tax=Sulfuriferula thiophila TaxID=1781211 RepID=UPI000F60A1A9|nr:YciI family protein [Sulfuriferula thiophila]
MSNWYAIIGEDVADSIEKRMGVRPAHLARLQTLQDLGRLLIAGPFPAIDSNDPGPAGFSGSLIVAEFDSLADAQTWADADPYVSAGVYTHVTVKPFKKVFPA